MLRPFSRFNPTTRKAGLQACRHPGASQVIDLFVTIVVRAAIDAAPA
jgi:hypothetical protein